MKKVFVVILLCALWYPAAGFAAVIKSTTESSADSGGNSAGSGGRVITGSERAAAYSVTIVGTKDGTTVEIRVATTSRGGSGDKSKATTSLLLQQSVNESLSEALSTTSPPWSSPLDVLRGFFDRVFMIFRLPL